MSDPTPTPAKATAPAHHEPKIDRVTLRTRVASHCFPLRVQQTPGALNAEEKRKSAAAEAVKDADALLAALGY